jgi:hypothetical protein
VSRAHLGRWAARGEAWRTGCHAELRRRWSVASGAGACATPDPRVVRREEQSGRRNHRGGVPVTGACLTGQKVEEREK